MNKTKLIRIAREYIELPDDTKEIEYDYYNGCSSLSFYTTINMPMFECDSQYFITVTLTENILEIKATAAEPYQDTWYKVIEL